MLKKEQKIQTYLFPNKYDAHSFKQLLASTNSHLKICVFQYSDNGIHKILERLGSKGVSITFITSSQIFKRKQHSQLSQKMRALLFNLLIKHPMKVNIYLLELEKGLMHNKFFIIDDKILGTGSLNWTSTAMQINYENLIIIKDDQAVKNYSNYFYDLWKNATQLKINKEQNDFNFVNNDSLLFTHPPLQKFDLLKTEQVLNGGSLLSKMVEQKHYMLSKRLKKMQKIQQKQISVEFEEDQCKTQILSSNFNTNPILIDSDSQLTTADDIQFQQVIVQIEQTDIKE